MEKRFEYSFISLARIAIPILKTDVNPLQIGKISQCSAERLNLISKPSEQTFKITMIELDHSRIAITEMDFDLEILNELSVSWA